VLARDTNVRAFLVSEVALEQAEAGCLADSESRALRREHDAGATRLIGSRLRRSNESGDLEVVSRCPPKRAPTIAEHTARRGSRRVGSTVASQSLEEEALTLAAVAHTRPRYGNYDELLMSGYECSEARAEIHDEVDRVLDRWRNPL
jgi:hypothetical protein